MRAWDAQAIRNSSGSSGQGMSLIAQLLKMMVNWYYTYTAQVQP